MRLRSRISDLALELKLAHPDITDAICRIGRVRYLTPKKMRDVANNTFDDYGIGVDRLFESLLIKRPAFKHEREVRLLYFELDDSRVGQDAYAYGVDPHNMISQIMLDPRLSRADAAAMTEEIRTVTGFEGPIKRSLLYAPPPSKILGVSDWEL